MVAHFYFSYLPSLFISLLLETSLSQKVKFIHNASEFIQFSNDTNDGITYSGYTVYLVSDIYFNEEHSLRYKPITNFLGTFDGQGYVISNLTLNSPSSATGLFGFSIGAIIKNLVTDNSYSVIYSRSFDSAFIGSIIGYCDPSYQSCILDNIINMGNVTFSGNLSIDLHLGGILGVGIPSATYSVTVKNCVNYGAVTHKGIVSGYHDIGGIVGHLIQGEKYVYNCVNYGTLTFAGSTTRYSFVGGIVGWARYGTSTIVNCLSAGKINAPYSSLSYTGNIAGVIGDNVSTSVVHCYWTSNTGYSTVYGDYHGSRITVSNTSAVEMSTTTMDALNDYATSNSWNEWSYSQNNVTINFVIHDKSNLSCSSQLILFPVVERRGYSFLFWCVNQNSTDNCNIKYNRSKTSEFTGDTTLYAQWAINKCTVIFDVNGGYDLPGNKKSVSTVYDQKISVLPVVTRRGYSFTGWYTVCDELITKESLVNSVCNYTLYAHWIPNNYTVIFDVNKGDKLDSNIIEVTFDSMYGELPFPSRGGFDFVGWYTKEGKCITSDTVVNITASQTLYAHWNSKNYTVTLDINGGDALTEKEKIVIVPSDKAYYYLVMPTRKGYAFTGWFTEDNKLITNDTATTAIITKNQTLYAHWTPNNYVVTFDVNGGNELSGEEESIMVTFNTTYNSLPEPSREGYSFSQWNSEKNGRGINVTKDIHIEVANDHTLYAQWIINQYVLKFLFNNNSGPEVRILDFNSLIDYPKEVTREGYKFNGWNDTISFMPARDITIAAQWTSGISSLIVSAIVISISVLIFIIIVIVVIVIIFVFFKKNDNDNRRRRFELEKPLVDEKDINVDEYFRVVSLNINDLENETTTNNNPRSILTNLYPKGYVRPAMRDALLKAELPKERVEHICSACTSKIMIDERTSAEGFTEDDALSIFMYTYDFGPKEYEHNPYRVINRSLVERNYAALQKVSGMLYLVMTALRKLPRVTGKTLYRGVKGEVNLDKDHYFEGNVITWMALSSTSPDMKAAKAFLAKGTKSMKAAGTLFIIENGWGYDIQPYSMFPNEAEILIEPERQFKVTGVIEAELNIINLVMLDTPLSVPEIFGYGEL